MGPTVPAALPTIDRGIQVLQRAGFGADATLVYRFLLNTAFMMVAVEDDRDERPETRGRMAEVLSDFRDAGRPGLAAASVDALARARDPRPAVTPGLPCSLTWSSTSSRWPEPWTASPRGWLPRAASPDSVSPGGHHRHRGAAARARPAADPGGVHAAGIVHGDLLRRLRRRAPAVARSAAAPR
ncbi:hypothetical protein [Frankia sp. AiPa1]|uniref:hypothetical protein n=1 Tax=Frankia sp. AiPa1 TaxID=573492 RepID=UPI00202B61CF|nr:hypothetical protein [Frankia sp. AiPa1]MCL9761208.1 hypothetical protein [Frankia sp. AiPa1]